MSLSGLLSEMWKNSTIRKTIKAAAAGLAIASPWIVHSYMEEPSDFRVPGEIAAEIEEIEEKTIDGKIAEQQKEQPLKTKQSQKPKHEKKKIQPVMGVNYASWTTGEFPFSAPWKPQRYYDSQGILEADITSEKPYKGTGSLELTLNIGKDTTNRQGEVILDLRYKIPNYDAESPIEINTDKEGNPIGIDLSGKTLAALVFCELGTGGEFKAPNGLQLFAKSLSIAGGNEVWKSYYGNWHNIWQEKKNWHSDPRLGYIEEGKWGVIRMRIPELDTLKNPKFGEMEEGFDPTNIAAIGLKYGSNAKTKWGIRKKIFVDQLGWAGIDIEGRNYEWITHLDPEELVKTWSNFTSLPPKKIELKKHWSSPLVLSPVSSCAYFAFDNTEDPLTTLARNNYNSVAIVQTEYMKSPDSSLIIPIDGKTHTNKELVQLIGAVHDKDMMAILKPHVDILDNSWRGDMSPKDREEWFHNYTDFILHYARIAEENDAEMLLVGTELKSMARPEDRQQWEKIIRLVRRDYNGVIGYAANWDNYKNVCLFGMIDFLGVNGYFPLSNEKNPSLTQLIEGWQKWVKELSDFHSESGLDIIFTEIGYRSTDFAAREPWEFRQKKAPNEALQKRCYQAIFEACGSQPWFKGLLVWNWLPRKDYGGKHNTGFTPQNKDAEGALVGYEIKEVEAEEAKEEKKEAATDKVAKEKEKVVDENTEPKTEQPKRTLPRKPLVELIKKRKFGSIEILPYHLAMKGYGSNATVIDANNCSHKFERFSFDDACIADCYHHAPGLNSDAITMIDECRGYNKGWRYHIFWTPLIKRIERNESGSETTIQFKDGSSFTGIWIPNESPTNFYRRAMQGYATGLIPANSNSNGEEPRYRIIINNIKSIEFDTAQENENFRKSLESFMRGVEGNKKYSAKKTVELKDGTRISTDIGYIVDCCGHHGGNRWHERMLYFCSTYNPEEEGNSKQRKHVTNTPLTEISEIELTGKFDEKNKQCREAVIRYRDGREEKKDLFLTSESYVGTCYPSQPYREYDKIALHNEHGALIVPLDEVKRIIIPYEQEAKAVPAEEKKNGSP